MDRIPPIKTVMTPFPHWVEMDAGLDVAVQMMASHDIRHLPVVDRGKLVSVLTADDVEHARSSAQKTAVLRDICKLEAFVVPLTEPLDRVLLHMAQHHLDCAIVAKNDKPVGIFTMTDVCRSFGHLLQTLFPPSGSGRIA